MFGSSSSNSRPFQALKMPINAKTGQEKPRSDLCQSVNRAVGTSEIEGKAAKGSGERVGKRASSNLWTIIILQRQSLLARSRSVWAML